MSDEKVENSRTVKVAIPKQDRDDRYAINVRANVTKPVRIVKKDAAKKATVKKDKKKKAKKPRTRVYLNNRDLLMQLEMSHAQNKLTDELAKMFMTLVDRYASKARFAVTDSFKSDMKAFALMTTVRVWRSFNAEKSQNPFAYFTTVVTHAFYQYMNQEKKQRDIKNELLIEIDKSPSYSYMVNYEEEQRKEHDIYEGTNIDGDTVESPVTTIDG